MLKVHSDREFTNVMKQFGLTLVSEMDRYDRQLRLWGNDGQEKLKNAHIGILTPCYPTNLIHEVLKNVLLLGVLQITIVSVDSGEGAGTRKEDPLAFFDEKALFGIKGLNPTGDGKKRQIDWDDAKASVDWSAFSVILELDLGWKQFTAWERFKSEAKYVNFPPSLVMLTTGRFSYYHLALTEPHFVINTRLEHMLPVFRFNNPWYELRRFIDSIEPPTLSSEEFSKLPYPVIIFKVLEWCLEKPKSSKELQEKIDLYLDSMKVPKNIDLNVIEAKRFAHLATKIVDHKLQGTLDLLDQCKHYLSIDLKKRWYSDFNKQMAALLYCLEKYIKRFGDIPLSGEFPDMESGSAHYGALKSIYDDKKLHDLKAFKEIVYKLLGDRVPDTLVESFCNNLGFISCLSPTTTALDSLYECQGSDSLMANTAPIGYCYPNDAFMAGLISQEMIKIVTHQYLPINDTFKYDAFNIESGAYKL